MSACLFFFLGYVAGQFASRCVEAGIRHDAGEHFLTPAGTAETPTTPPSRRR